MTASKRLTFISHLLCIVLGLFAAQSLNHPATAAPGDNFSNVAPGLSSPASGAQAITPSNSVDLPITTRGIYVGGAGDVVVDMADGRTTSITFTAANAGTIL